MNPTIQEKLTDIFSKYKETKYKKGDELLTPGDEPNSIFYLKEGFVRQYTISPKGFELTLHIYRAGSFFPLTWGITNIDIRHYFKSITDITVIKVPREDIVTMLRNEPDILFDLSNRLLFAVDGLVTRIEFLTLANAESRVAGSLLYLAKHFGNSTKEGIIIDQRFTHEEIAGIAGLARETTSQNLEKLQKKEVITYTNHLILVRDMDVLKEYAATD